MKSLIALLVSGLFLPMLGQDAPKESCSLSTVEWFDAALYQKMGGIEMRDIDDLILPTKSIGCVRVMERTVLIIFHFVAGKPDTYLSVPKTWLIKITPLQAVPQEAKK